MKQLILATSLIFSGLNLSAHEIDFTVQESPIVIRADLKLNEGQADERTVTAPWIMFAASANNHSHHDIQTNLINVTCVGGFGFYTKLIPLAVTVKMGETVDLTEYIDGLPANETNVYECSVAMQWSGPRHSHLTTFQIVSQ